MEDRRTQKVLGFLIAKGFLFGTKIKRRPNVKIFFEEALWVGHHVEPRVIEVLPAAILHFPKTFIGYNDMPAELNTIISLIKKHKEEGPDYKGIRFYDMKRWADRLLPDKRTKPSSEIRINKTYRFTLKTLEKMKIRSKTQGLSITQYLERLVHMDFKKNLY